jgi:hypothetical protein
MIALLGVTMTFGENQNSDTLSHRLHDGIERRSCRAARRRYQSRGVDIDVAVIAVASRQVF